MTMMEDGVNACQTGQTGRPAKVMDVAELLWDSVRDLQTTEKTKNT
jgi:hypothetical protein